YPACRGGDDPRASAGLNRLPRPRPVSGPAEQVKADWRYRQSVAARAPKQLPSGGRLALREQIRVAGIGWQDSLSRRPPPFGGGRPRRPAGFSSDQRQEFEPII